MEFDSYFRLTSYATVAAAVLALWVAGGAGLSLMVIFTAALAIGFRLEGTKWQLSERAALIVIVSSVPVFYLDWRVLTPTLLAVDTTGASSEATGAVHGGLEVSVLAHLILFLSAVKLLQRKADRDWFFLYLISFFTVLLAAGLTVNPIFLATLIVYLLCVLSTVVAFEIQKARKKVTPTQTRLLVPPDNTLFRKLPMRLWQRRYLETRRLPFVSAGLLLLIVILALPFFLIAPRTASSALKRGGRSVGGFIGFSDNVTLGQIGELKASDEIFMHVRVDNPGSASQSSLRWRGVALDEFNGKAWKKSAIAERGQRKQSESGFFKLGTTEDINRLTAQTFILEPVDTPVIFAAPRVVAVQAKLPSITVDSEGAVQAGFHDQRRLVYRAYSDMSQPAINVLRADRLEYGADDARYLELPSHLDPRIRSLALEVIQAAGARNGYDEARAVENYLRNNLGYTLELKAGGPDPLADFLFHVREGHCEYFATAMAVMLRTLGIPTRIVNGFLPGEYNGAADAFTVRQSDAHSWVEVYFPQTNSWVTFDPTPPAGRTTHARTGLAGAVSKYSEALELMWFQYVVGYDKQEQRSLITSMRTQLFDLQRGSLAKFDQARTALPSLARPILIGFASVVGLLAALFLIRRVRRFGWQRALKVWQSGDPDEMSRVDFYKRLLQALEKQGIKRDLWQTPLEFASAVDISQARAITNAYNRVRFGGEDLTERELQELHRLLRAIETDSRK
jgi:transglutaminase-like putative cysteine protease